MAGPSDQLLRRLEWQVIRRLDGRLQGSYRTVFRGAGIDFADLRSYTPEDDVRHIDWNVTARLDEPFVRRYNEDRDLTAWLVLDRSASMSSTLSDRGKDTVLVQLALSLTRLFTRGGNRVGMILFDNAFQHVIPPGTSRNHVLRLGHELLKPGPPQAAGQTTDLAAMIELAAATARRRSLVFVVSDFLGEPNWVRPLGRLAHRHEVVVLRIVDPRELDVPDLGLMVVEDAETGEQLLIDSSDPIFRARLEAEVAGQEAGLTAAMQQAGVVPHRVSTDADLGAALVDLVRRSKGRRP